MNDDNQALLHLHEALAEIISHGLTKLATRMPDAALQLSQQLENDEVYFQFTGDYAPLKMAVDVIRRDGTGEPVRFFELSAKRDTSTLN